VTGLDIGDKKVFYIEPDDFVLNIVFAWEGAVAVTSDAEAGMIASHRFPTFRPDPVRLDVKYLQYWCQTELGRNLLDRVSPGGAGRNRTLNRDAFLNQEVALPPLAQQRRVVARIEELAAQIHEARTLRQQAAEEADALCRGVLSNDRDATPTPMRELVRLRAPDIAVEAGGTYQFGGVYSFGRGVFRAQTRTGMEFAYPRLTRLRTGDFVYPKLMAWEGAFGVVPPECDGCVVSTEFPVFEVLEEKVYPAVLDIHFRSPEVWREISRASTGTNVRRRRLNPDTFMDYRMPLPSRPTQESLRNIKGQVDALKRLQAEIAIEFDALQPAILARAFKGDL
jgi:type I restriction enzyme S subunit